MSRRSLRALIAFLLFYVGFGAWLTVNQQRVVYQPWPQDFATCPRLADATQVTYRGTRMYVHATSGPIAVLYHGNAGAACDRAFLAERISQAGLGYILVEYAGYSNDPVPPSHERIKQDVQNVIAYLDTHAFTSVALIGESIGAGVASYHARLAPPDRLLLISPFPDLQAVAATRFWFYPTRLLVDNAYGLERDLARYRGPVTLIHGTDDRIIPFRLGQTLYEQLATEKQLVPIDGAGHNDLFQYDATYRVLAEFLTSQ